MYPACKRIFALIAILGAPTIGAQVRQLDHVGVAGGSSFHTNSSHGRAMSRNGRYVVFRSIDTTLVPGSSNDRTQVYLVDRETRSVEFISVGLNGPGNSDSLNPTISHDGRHVAFMSNASNLVIGDTNNVYDVFVRDRVAGTTTRVSVGTGNIQATSESNYPTISGDGRIVAFASAAPQLATGLDGQMHVYVHDRNSATTQRISRRLQSGPGAGVSRGPALSTDGRFVAFESVANDVVPGDSDYMSDVFVFDRVEQTVTLVSNRFDGSNSASSSFGPSISDDGRHVAFHAYDALIPNDSNGHIDGYVFDRETQELRRVTLNHLQGQLDLGSGLAVISGDGQWVAFASSSSGTVPGIAGGLEPYVYLRHINDGVVRLVSVNTNGEPPDAGSNFPTIGRNGTLVGFSSEAANLVPTTGAPTNQLAMYVAAPEFDTVNADGFE